MLTIDAVFAPPAYCKASPELIAELTNGCGAADAKFDFVPDKIWGLSIEPACRVHDWMYLYGQTIADKDEADRVFMNNMLRLIHLRSANKFIRYLRNKRALSYYQAVQSFGGPAFWAAK